MITVCPACRGNRLVAGTLPAILADLRIIAGEASTDLPGLPVHLRICQDCGLVSLSVPKQNLDKLKQKVTNGSILGLS
jgi:hypothetical protein